MKNQLTTILLLLLVCFSIIPVITIEAEASVGDKCQYCGHKPFLADPYDKKGNCEECGKAYDYKSSKKSESGMFMTNKDVKPSSTPYEATKVDFTILKGEIVTVVASYTNAKDNVWYEVKYGNNKTGYIYKENIDKIADANNVYSLSGYITVHHTKVISLFSAPSTDSRKTNLPVTYDELTVSKLVKAKDGYWWYYGISATTGNKGWMQCLVAMNVSFSYSGVKETSSIIKGTPVPSSIPNTKRELEGSIQTSGQKIYRVSAAIYNGTNTSGTPVTGGDRYTVNTTSYNFKGSDVSKNLAFENLTPGKQYTLKISVEIVGCKCYYDDASKDYIYTVDKTWTFTVSCSHSYSSSYTKDSNNHWQVCTICGGKGTVSKHSYSNNCDTSCNTCGYTRSITHTYSNSCDTSCNVCGATRTTSHSYSNNCDTSCNVCGATRAASHSYGSSYTYNSDTHWKTCSVCGEKGTASSHSYSNNCDKTCNTCEYTRSITHTYSNNCDTSCNVCGANRTIKHTYTNNCDTSCDVCGETRTTSHSYSNSCDTSCNVCGATRTTSHSYGSSYTYNSDTHWKTCSVCGGKGTTSSHSYSNNCDKTCNTCGYTRSITHTYSNSCDASCNVCGETRTTSHSYGSSYTYNSDTHWKTCTVCGNKGSSSYHTYDNNCDTTCNVCGNIRTSTHTYSNSCDASCNVCGATRTVTHSYTNDCDSSCNICGETRNTQHVYDDEDDTTCNVCGETRTLSTTTGPEETTTEPDETTPDPEETTTEPDETTPEPEETTTEPEETTPDPEETTTEPDETTPEPEDISTTGPEETSGDIPANPSTNEEVVLDQKTIITIAVAAAVTISTISIFGTALVMKKKH